ncbi:hypothetical protein EDB83DRAFT_2317281 [Lactarius deliciosus]|nr:hypothetical protein EDB83DRAFT_2317281 [Lactarius deliciosus]
MGSMPRKLCGARNSKLSVTPFSTGLSSFTTGNQLEELKVPLREVAAPNIAEVIAVETTRRPASDRSKILRKRPLGFSYCARQDNRQTPPFSHLTPWRSQTKVDKSKTGSAFHIKPWDHRLRPVCITRDKGCSSSSMLSREKRKTDMSLPQHKTITNSPGAIAGTRGASMRFFGFGVRTAYERCAAVVPELLVVRILQERSKVQDITEERLRPDNSGPSGKARRQAKIAPFGARIRVVYVMRHNRGPFAPHNKETVSFVAIPLV